MLRGGQAIVTATLFLWEIVLAMMVTSREDLSTGSRGAAGRLCICRSLNIGA